MKTLNSHDLDILLGLLNDGRLADAEHNARALLDTHTEAGILWKLLGVTLARQGKDALEAFRRAANLMPNDVDALLHAANAAREAGQMREALPLYQRALHLEPHSIEAINNSGNLLLQLGLFDQAIACYRRALALASEDAQVLCNLGNALRQKGSMDEALAVTRRAIALSQLEAPVSRPQPATRRL
jgi:tetratricopeptide (TPR) repeat protein